MSQTNAANAATRLHQWNSQVDFRGYFCFIHGQNKVESTEMYVKTAAATNIVITKYYSKVSANRMGNAYNRISLITLKLF